MAIRTPGEERAQDEDDLGGVAGDLGRDGLRAGRGCGLDRRAARGSGMKPHSVTVLAGRARSRRLASGGVSAAGAARGPAPGPRRSPAGTQRGLRSARLTGRGRTTAPVTPERNAQRGARPRHERRASLIEPLARAGKRRRLWGSRRRRMTRGTRLGWRRRGPAPPASTRCAPTACAPTQRARRFKTPRTVLALMLRGAALLRKSPDGRGSPFPGQAHPTASVRGMPSDHACLWASRPRSSPDRTRSSASRGA